MRIQNSSVGIGEGNDLMLVIIHWQWIHRGAQSSFNSRRKFPVLFPISTLLPFPEGLSMVQCRLFTHAPLFALVQGNQICNSRPQKSEAKGWYSKKAGCTQASRCVPAVIP